MGGLREAFDPPKDFNLLLGYPTYLIRPLKSSNAGITVSPNVVFVSIHLVSPMTYLASMIYWRLTKLWLTTYRAKYRMAKFPTLCILLCRLSL